MTSAMLANDDGPLGWQRPRISHVPDHVSSSAIEVLQFCESVGLILDPWEEYVLTGALGEREDGSWAAPDVGVVAPRQNGKGAILEARELGGLFILGEPVIIHSAHEFRTSRAGFKRLLHWFDDSSISRRVRRVSQTNGDEGVYLKSGQVLQFRTRTKTGGRGLTADCLILDEAMILSENTMSALIPTLSARRNRQLWYTGSSVDQEVHEHGQPLARLRRRGMTGSDNRVAYFEWSIDEAAYKADPAIADDVHVWAQSNPGLGIQLHVETIADERRNMTPQGFATERLGVGNWPTDEDDKDEVISMTRWRDLADGKSEVVGTPAFGVDSDPHHRWTSIGVCGVRPDGAMHVEMVAHRSEPASEWLVDEVLELHEAYPEARVVIDGRGPAASYVEDLQRAGVPVTLTTTADYVKACSNLLDRVNDGSLRWRRYPGIQTLTEAVQGAATRPVGDAWAWSRKHARVDISPLVAVTLALWGVSRKAPVRRRARMTFAGRVT